MGLKRSGRWALLFSVSALCLGAGVGHASQKSVPRQAWVEAERDFEGDVRIVVIQREGAVAERAAVRLEQRSLGRIGRSFKRIAGDVIKVPAGRLSEVLDELEADPDVELVAPDRKDQRMQSQEVPWGISMIGADPPNRAALDLGNGAGVKVAVIDTGIWWSSASRTVHPDLAAAYRGGYDFVNEDPFPWDDNGHGTFIAGVLAASDNDIGVVGVAPGVSLYALKVLDEHGLGYYSDFIAALDWCIEHGIRIVNYSGGGPPSLPLERACSRARAAGVTIVAAAGNGGGGLLYPAAYPSVISVGAIDMSGFLWEGSNTGQELDLVAPGVSVLSLHNGAGSVELTGTSMAVPHVTGVAALYAGRTMVTDPQLVQEYLQATADDLGDPGQDPEYGHGRVHARLLSTPLPAILAPLPGEIVPSGVPYYVSWNPVPGAATYRVLFARSGSYKWTQVAGSITDTWAAWRPPVVGAPLNSGRLQVAAYAADGTLLSVDTRVGFAIKSIHITAPAIGASFNSGDSLQLQWAVYKTPRRVARIAVDVSSNGGRTWKRLRRFYPSVRSYNWVVPYVVAPRQLKLRVVLYDRDGVKISSDAIVFTVTAASTVASGDL